MRKGLRVLFATIMLLVSCSCFANSPAALRVAFVNPDEQGDAFWDSVTRFMQEVAEDLNIHLDVFYTNKDRFKSYQLLREVLTRPDAPDYLLYIYQAGTGKRILDLAEEYGVPSFLFNTAIHPKEEAIVGEPRGRYKYWIGHMYPDDMHAGDLLGRSLLAQAVPVLKPNEGELIEVLAISGGLDSAVSGLRNRGLEQAIAKFGYAELKQLVYAQWEPDIAVKQLSVLNKRYPKARVVWSASDTMALAIAQEMNQDQSMVIGGIDWTMEGLRAVQNGQLNASVGGHYMEGGWSLVLIHDYHMGKDFGVTSPTIKTRMQLIHKGNVDRYLNEIRHNDYERVDFKQFSKIYHPERPYDFSLEAVNRALR